MVDIPELNVGGYLHGNLFPALELLGETAEFTVLSRRVQCALMSCFRAVLYLVLRPRRVRT